MSDEKITPSASTGRCLCGTVTYEVTGAIGPAFRCYCRSCQCVTGSAFAAVASVGNDRFRLLTGADSLGCYESSPGKKRYFCNQCGSPVFVRTDAQPEVTRLRLGGIEKPQGVETKAHIFVDEKVDWYEIGDDLPQHGGWPGPR